jgi:hypothetical protein
MIEHAAAFLWWCYGAAAILALVLALGPSDDVAA